MFYKLHTSNSQHVSAKSLAGKVSVLEICKEILSVCYFLVGKQELIFLWWEK